jgi:hypothetical protein
VMVTWTGLAGIDIPHDAGFAGMGARNHLAGCPVDQTRDSRCCHCDLHAARGGSRLQGYGVL